MTDELAQAKEKARTSEATGDKMGALNAYNLVIYHSSAPREIAETYLAKARILVQLGHADKAEQHIERAIEAHPELPAAWVRYADFALGRGDWAEASARAERAIPYAGTGAEGLWLLECVALGKERSPASAAAGLRARV